MNVFVTLAAASMLAACAAKPVPVPYAIERASLPADSYDAMEQAAAAASPVPAATPRPEPAWAYAVQPGFAPQEAPLRVAAFRAAPGERATAVATELTGAVAAAVGPLFAPVAGSIWQGGPVDEFVLSGTVLRADEQPGGKQLYPATQIEAVLRRGAITIGVLQINALQPPAGTLTPLGPNATTGTRAGYAATLMWAALADAATQRTTAAVAPPSPDGQYLTARPE